MKTEIEDKAGIPPEHQRVVFEDSSINNIQIALSKKQKELLMRETALFKKAKELFACEKALCKKDKELFVRHMIRPRDGAHWKGEAAD